MTTAETKTTHYYVFNGDADGLCALQQIRLPLAATNTPDLGTCITGVKRDTALLSRLVDVSGADITVLDIGLDQNAEALQGLLQRDCRVVWFDHHVCQESPAHPALTRHIDFSAHVNTSLLVHHAQGKPYPLWVAVGLFGDQLDLPARQLTAQEHLTDAETEQLRECGILMNYNAYGQSVADLHYHPLHIMEMISPFASPLDMLKNTTFIATLKEAYQSDMAQAFACKPAAFPNLYILPSTAWARRISGAFSNALTCKNPAQPIAVLVGNEAEGYVVSVRTPRNVSIHTTNNAAALCREFPTGGGRMTAAGINHLPATLLEAFITRFQQFQQYDRCTA